MIFKSLTLKTRIILILQSIAMLSGTSTHLFWLLKNAFLSENYHAPVLSMIFWDALTFLDPLAAILLILKPRLGIYFTAIIIGFDVLHNNIVYFKQLYLASFHFTDWMSNYWMILWQIAFAVFVFVPLKSNLKEVKIHING